MTYRIGVGAGFAGDRYEPAVLLAREAGLDALVFECLAERTIGLAQYDKVSGTNDGYDHRILRRLRSTLPFLLPTGAVVVTNAGAANPVAAARATARLVSQLGGPPVPVAAVHGDDVLDRLDLARSKIHGSEQTLDRLADRIISANAYVGGSAIRHALDAGARVVLTGRCADAALFAAPIAHHFGWSEEDLERTAEATLVGHLLECGGQLSGGYFVDGMRKLVPDLATLGFPYADVGDTGIGRYGKVAGTGGLINRRTVLEQLLYEIDDPRRYITPDVTLDLCEVRIDEVGPDKVEVSGARERGRPDQLKVSVGVRDGYIALAEISYAGSGCLVRGGLARDVIAERWSDLSRYDPDALRCDVIGVNATRPWWPGGTDDPGEVRLRFSTRTFDRRQAETLLEEVEALYTNGPAGGGGVTSSIKETVGIISTMISRSEVSLGVEIIR